MKNRLLLTGVIFALFSLYFFLGSDVPTLSDTNRETVVEAPVWIFWKDSLMLEELAGITYGMVSIVHILSLVTILMCLPFTNISTAVTRLLVTGAYTTKRGTKVHWPALVTGFSLGLFVNVLLVADFLSATIIFGISIIGMRRFQKLLQRIHNTQMSERRLVDRQ